MARKQYRVKCPNCPWVGHRVATEVFADNVYGKCPHCKSFVIRHPDTRQSRKLEQARAEMELINNAVSRTTTNTSGGRT